MFLLFSHFIHYMNSGTGVSLRRSMDCDSSASTSEAGHCAFDVENVEIWNNLGWVGSQFPQKSVTNRSKPWFYFSNLDISSIHHRPKSVCFLWGLGAPKLRLDPWPSNSWHLGLVVRFGHRKFLVFITHSVGVENWWKLFHHILPPLLIEFRYYANFGRRRTAETVVPDSEVQFLAVWKFGARSTFRADCVNKGRCWKTCQPSEFEITGFRRCSGTGRLELCQFSAILCETLGILGIYWRQTM